MYLFIVLVIVLVIDIKDCDAYDVSRSQNNNLPINLFANSKYMCWFTHCWNSGSNCASGNCCFCKCSQKKIFYSDKLGCLSTDDVKKEILKTGKKCDFFTQTIPLQYIPIYELESNFQNVELSLREGFRFENDPATCSAGAIYLHDFHGHAKLYKRNECQNLLSAQFKDKKLYLDWHSSNTSNWNNMKGHLMSVEISCNFQAINSCFIFQVQGNYTLGEELEEPYEQQNCTDNYLTIRTTLIIEGNNTKTSTSIIVGSVVCVVLLLVFLGAFFITYWCRRKPEGSVLNDAHFRLINKEASAQYNSEPAIEIKRNKLKFSNAPFGTSSNASKDESVEYESIDVNHRNSSLKHYNTLERKELNGIYQEDTKSITGTLSKRPLPDRPIEVSNPYYASNFLGNQAVYASSTEPADKKNTNPLSQLPNNELKTIDSTMETLNKYDYLPTATLNKFDLMPPLSRCEEAPIYANTLSSTPVDKKEPLYDSPNPTANRETELNPLYTLYSTIPDVKIADEDFVI